MVSTDTRVAAQACGLNNVFSVTTPNDDSAHRLLSRFRLCSAAKALLAEAAQKIKLFVILDDYTSTAMPRYVRKDDVHIETRMHIQKRLDTPNGLDFLAQSVLRADDPHSETHRLGVLGELGMGTFVQSVHDTDMRELDRKVALWSTCEPMWKVKKPETIARTEQQLLSLDPAGRLWIQEARCHLDDVRSRWIDQYGAAYCKNHPEDHASCDIERGDLCSGDALERLPPGERDAIITERMQARLSEAPASIKHNFHLFQDPMSQPSRRE